MHSSILRIKDYLNGGVNELLFRAYMYYLTDPKEGRFINRVRRIYKKSEKRRMEIAEREGIEMPFLMTCQIDGREVFPSRNGSSAPSAAGNILQDEEWLSIFRSAADDGIVFTFIIGGEPLKRKELLVEAAKIKEMIFPIFTDGKLINEFYFKLFERYRNLVPLLRYDEGWNASEKDAGNNPEPRNIAEELGARSLPYCVSIEVNAENLNDVTSDNVIGYLHKNGTRLVLYLGKPAQDCENPASPQTEKETAELEARIARLREQYPDIFFYSFPGEEKSCGCMAAGRGLFHIACDGTAYPCPFVDEPAGNVISEGIKGVLNSAFFTRLRACESDLWKNDGRCTLCEHCKEVSLIARECRK